MMKFDAGNPVVSGYLVEDLDGALLPHEMQRDGAVWRAVLTAMSLIDPEADDFVGDVGNVLRSLTPVLWPLLPSNYERDLSGLDAHQLREAGYRVLDDRQCCELACNSGACESCPCCCAGWCVWGHDGEIPDIDNEDYKIWLEVAAEHNPVVKQLAEAEKALSDIKAMIPEIEADIPEDAGNATSHRIASRLRTVIARGGGR